MARPGKPWWRKTHRMWYFTSPDGKQVPTGITDPNDEVGAAAARQRFLEELAASITAKLTTARIEPPALATGDGVPVENRTPAPARAGRTLTVSQAVADYLADRKGRVSAGTIRGYTFHLQTHFCAVFGYRPLNSLTADEIERWAEARKWSDSTRHSVLGNVQTFLKAAGYPLAIKRPPKESRGASVVLTDEQFQKVLDAYDPRYGGGELRELLKVLRESGARPGEITGLTVEELDWQNACVRKRQHKTRRHGKDRIIYFPESAMTILSAQREKHPTGHLFLTRHGNPYSPHRVRQLMNRLSKRVGFRAIAYGAGRHSFATKALVAGVPDTVVAALLGHTSTQMIHAHYSHVAEQSKVLRAAVEKVSQAKTD